MDSSPEERPLLSLSSLSSVCNVVGAGLFIESLLLRGEARTGSAAALCVLTGALAFFDS